MNKNTLHTWYREVAHQCAAAHRLLITALVRRTIFFSEQCKGKCQTKLELDH
jgi:hypothetical protein